MPRDRDSFLARIDQALQEKIALKPEHLRAL
jgi:hypothetical protein